MGMSVGHSINEPQWTPDMRKDDKDITEAEKKEAQRRIQGTNPAEDSPEDSGSDDLTTLPPPASAAAQAAT